MAIKKDTLHPENEPEVDIYPKTSIDQVENLQANLDALNGEIANISTNVNQNIIDISDIKDDITVLNTAYGSYTDYTEVTNGFLLTYLSGKQIELPIKAGTNVTFSKYPGSNQIIINSTGGSVPDNIALLDTANTFTAENTFNETTYYNSKVFVENTPIVFRNSTKKLLLTFTYYGFVKSNIDTGNDYSYTFPNKTGTLALTTDIPSLADYPTTIFFNNYNAGIGYKDTSTGTIKTVVSTDNNGAQIVLGDSNTGLTLATNARPKVLEDSTVKEVAYVSDIPAISNLGNFTFSDNNMNIRGSTAISRSTGSPTEFIFGNYDNTFRSASSGLFTFYNQNAYAAINLAGKIGPQTIAFKSDIPNTSSFATLAGNNNWTGDNIFDGFSKSIRVNGLFQVSGDEELISATYNQVSYDGFNIAYMDGENQNIFHVGIDFENKARFGFDKYDGSSYNLYIPEKDGTIALLSDIPISLMYSSSRLGENSVDFPFNIDKNYFFTITMTNTGESKSFIYAKGTSSTYTIVINSSTSFEVKLDATGSSTRLIFTNKSNADHFVVRAEISN